MSAANVSGYVRWRAMTRVLSGIQPSGDLHLGNYLGAIRNWARIQHTADAFHPVVDLHAVTVPQEPGELGKATLRMSQMLMAAGLDPEVCTIFVQSHVREHTECAWLLECTVSFGELSRMTQFKDKSGQQQFISAGLFTYPALQAADILLYDADEVPVGADQRQHIELTRDIAERFNSRYGPTFKLPAAVVPASRGPSHGPSAPDQQDVEVSGLAPRHGGPTRRPVRCRPQDQGRGHRQRSRGPLRRRGQAGRVEPAVDPRGGHRPRAGGGGRDYSMYGPLKADTAEAVVELLRPIQTRFAELEADPGETSRLLEMGAGKARAVAAVTLDRARSNIGLLAP